MLGPFRLRSSATARRPEPCVYLTLPKKGAEGLDFEAKKKFTYATRFNR